jgi:ABC-type nitrate/sulfonate/bicarbonate transport system substrate-binding protein
VSGAVRSVGELGAILKERTGVLPYSGSLNAMNGFAQANPEAVKGFLEAWLEAVEYLQGNLEAWTKQAAALEIKNEAEVRLLMERISPLWPRTWNSAIVKQQIELLEFVQEKSGTTFLAQIPESAFTTAYTPASAA